MKIFGIVFLLFTTHAAQALETSFLDGSRVECFAAHVNARNALINKKINVTYRKEHGGSVVAYFQKDLKIKNYSFEGFCTSKLCQLGIRDLETNTVSMTNAGFVGSNDNTLQIQVMNFQEGVTLTLGCQLQEK